MSKTRQQLDRAIALLRAIHKDTVVTGPWGDDEGTKLASVCDACGGTQEGALHQDDCYMRSVEDFLVDPEIFVSAQSMWDALTLECLETVMGWFEGADEAVHPLPEGWVWADSDHVRAETIERHDGDVMSEGFFHAYESDDGIQFYGERAPVPVVLAVLSRARLAEVSSKFRAGIDTARAVISRDKDALSRARWEKTLRDLSQTRLADWICVCGHVVSQMSVDETAYAIGIHKARCDAWRKKEKSHEN